ncbi:hypothetical protein FB192DRAFT_1298445, partial [Mucor lusitanicus]
MRTKVCSRLSRREKTPRKVASSTIDQYVAAITDLYRSQVKRKINANSHPRLLVQDLIFVQKEKDCQTKRENFEDRGVGTLADSYTTMDQVAKVIKYYMDQDRSHGSNLRASTGFLFSHYFLLRSQSIVLVELTYILTVKLENEGISPEIECPALVLILRRGKTNKNNSLELGGCMRNVRVETGMQQNCLGQRISTRRLGRWNNITMNSAYSTGLPRKAMRVMAGFTIQPGQFFLARAALDPPEDLMKLVFPLLDQWNDRLLTKYDNQNNGDSMQVTVAAKACFDLFFRPEKINFARRRGNDGQGSKSPSLDQRNLCESYVFGVLGVCKISIIKVHHNEMADQLIFNQ